jgi:hypothetical protein
MTGVEHPGHLLTRRPSGGFILESADGSIEAVPVEGGRRLDGPDELRDCLLKRAGAHEGFVLFRAAGREEAGRTQTLSGVGRDAGLSFIQLDDGRVFRVMLRGPREPRFELLGWETPGPYLVAWPTEEGWKIRPEAACVGLGEIGPLTVLFAAEILEMEELSGSNSELGSGDS